MRVLFCVRYSFYEVKGGMYIQITKTKQYLESLGVECDITTTPYGVDYNRYDILHLTDLTWVYDNLIYIEQIERAGFSGKKVLSTIYWPFDDFAKNGVPFFQRLLFNVFGINGFEFFKSLAKFLIRRELIYLKGCTSSYINSQKKIVSFVDRLLPNAESEMAAIKQRLSYQENNYDVIYNSIDVHAFDAIIEENNVDKDENLIVFVGRIDPRKNQIGFLESIYYTGYKVRFIGSPGPNSGQYYERLKDIAHSRGQVEFVSHLTQEGVFLNMLEAKVHVLTSWIETPGLVSLEAAYAYCNIVVSDKGSVREYFNDYAFYCDPDSSESIRKAVVEAMSSPFKPSFRELIRNSYSWSKTASDTMDSYNKLVGNV